MKLYKTINPDSGKFVEGFPLLVKSGVCYFIKWSDVSKLLDGKLPKAEIIRTAPSRVCEFTGKKDSSGKDIWGNDLIKIFAPNRSYDGMEGVVFYDPELACWGVCNDYEFETPKSWITFENCYFNENVKLYVVGNIVKQGFSTPGQWYEYLCRKEIEMRMAEKNAQSLILEDDLPF